MLIMRPGDLPIPCPIPTLVSRIHTERESLVFSPAQPVEGFLLLSSPRADRVIL